jgi:hypothetical protein
MNSDMPKPLLWGMLVHGVLTLFCALSLAIPAQEILGVHPALKPFKFAISIALFLGSLGVVIPRLALTSTQQDGFAWMLTTTMGIEMTVILVQALRGTTSHFNIQNVLNRSLWSIMMFAIVVATVGMLLLAVIAMLSPLRSADGEPMPSLLEAAWRAALWTFLLSAVSGFSMGGRMQHSVGGADGGPGLPLLNWSLRYGDLRVSHFISMHALQTLPLLAFALMMLPLSQALRWLLLVSAIALHWLFGIGTLVRALSAKPLL